MSRLHIARRPRIMRQPTPGVNVTHVSIACRWSVQRTGVVNSRMETYAELQSNPSHGDETTNRVTHKFSPNNQAALYPVKLFGIIILFERCRELSTVACPLYEDCGDKVVQSS
jgi:hypothetical protein